MIQLRDFAEIFVFTSPAPWHPSTEITETAVDSMLRTIGGNVPVWIMADGPPSWATHDDVMAYTEYLHRLRQKKIGGLIAQSQWIGLSGLVSRVMRIMTRPILVNLQHDWEITHPELVDGSQLVEEMRKPDTPVKYVRFHKVALSDHACAKYTSYWEQVAPPNNLPLIASNGWGDSAHIATADHYRTTVAQHMEPCQKDDGRYGLERPLGLAYRAEQKRDGFRAAHAKWGSWFYGENGYPPMMRHLGDDTRRWRSERTNVNPAQPR